MTCVFSFTYVSKINGISFDIGVDFGAAEIEPRTDDRAGEASDSRSNCPIAWPGFASYAMIWS
jgi:hypothetical protein